MAVSNKMEEVTGLISTFSKPLSSACFSTSSRPYAVTMTRCGAGSRLGSARIRLPVSMPSSPGICQSTKAMS